MPNRAKPTFPQLNRSHPLAQGLVVCVPIFEGSGNVTDIARGLSSTGVGSLPVWKGSAYGYSLDWNGVAGTAWIERTPAIEPAGDVTAIALIKRNGTTGSYSRPFSKTYNNGTAPYVSYDVEINPGGAGQDFLNANISIGATLYSGAQVNFVDLTVPTVVGMAYRVSDHTLFTYKNGVIVDTTVVAGTGSLGYDATSTGRFIVNGQSSAAAGNTFAGEVTYVYVWNRLLTANEHISIVADPFQIYRKTAWRLTAAAAAASAIARRTFSFPGTRIGARRTQ